MTIGFGGNLIRQKFGFDNLPLLSGHYEISGVLNSICSLSGEKSSSFSSQPGIEVDGIINSLIFMSDNGWLSMKVDLNKLLLCYS
jgi:hypothetical protein